MTPGTGQGGPSLPARSAPRRYLDPVRIEGAVVVRARIMLLMTFAPRARYVVTNPAVTSCVVYDIATDDPFLSATYAVPSTTHCSQRWCPSSGSPF